MIFLCQKHKSTAKMIVKKLYIEPIGLLLSQYLASVMYALKSFCAH